MNVDQAIATLRALRTDIESSDDIPERYARAVLDVAVRRAGMRPTPQSRMAATGLRVSEGAIVGDAGTGVTGRGGSPSLGEVLWGSERGSTIYRQFGPPQRGAWMFPTFEDPGPSAIEAGEDALDDIIRRVV